MNYKIPSFGVTLHLHHQGGDDGDEVGLGNVGFYNSSYADVCKRRHY